MLLCVDFEVCEVCYGDIGVFCYLGDREFVVFCVVLFEQGDLFDECGYVIFDDFGQSCFWFVFVVGDFGDDFVFFFDGVCWNVFMGQV